MKIVLIAGILAIAILGSCNSNNKSGEAGQKDTAEVVTPVTPEEVAGISEVITRFVRAYSAKDNGKANALLHPDLGITIIYRPGVADHYIHQDSLDFSNPIPEHYAYSDLENNFALTFGPLPVFSCETEKWDRMGFVCDTTAHPNQLAVIADFENEFSPNTHAEAELSQIKKNEEESFRVIVTAAIPLVFHVQRYNGAWYVTVLDRAYAGCDA